MSVVSIDEANNLAYKSMNSGLYYIFTFLLYALEVYLSIVVDDISKVFGYIGTVAGTSLSFFIPSVLFCMGFSMFGSAKYRQAHKGWYVVSILNFILGLGFFGVFLYADL